MSTKAKHQRPASYLKKFYGTLDMRHKTIEVVRGSNGNLKESEWN